MLPSRGLIRLDFGKHKGKHIEQIHTSYLRWILENFPKSSPWWKVAEDALAERLQMTAEYSKQQQTQDQTHDLLNRIKRCQDLRSAKAIHAEAVQLRNDKDKYVMNALINVYRKCRSMVDARAVFDEIQEPSIVHWNTLLCGYAENGEPNVTLDLFSRVKRHGCVPNAITYVAALKACTSLVEDGDGSRKIECLKTGRNIHLQIGSHLDHKLQISLVDMYSKCGSMVEAHNVFDSIQKPDVVAWTALLLGYANNSEGYISLDLFSRMKNRGCAPNSVTYISVLKACMSLAMNGECLERCRQLHSEMEPHLDHCLQNMLVEVYSSCGSIVEARSVFDTIREPNVMHWTTLILGYAENGETYVALDLFATMKKRECTPDPVTYVAVLGACASIGALALGRKVHSEINQFTPHVVTCLVDFYGKCGSMSEALDVFHLHSGARDGTTWNSLIAGYGRFGDHVSAFNLFESMQDEEGLRPNAITFVCLLMCCNHAGLVKKAAECFEEMVGRYCLKPIVVHYNCMIDVLGRGNQLDEAIWIVRKMPCTPDVVTWITLMGACKKWKNVEIGREAFKALAEEDKKQTSAYVLMADIYASRGMWEEQKLLMRLVGTNIMS